MTARQLYEKMTKDFYETGADIAEIFYSWVEELENDPTPEEIAWTVDKLQGFLWALVLTQYINEITMDEIIDDIFSRYGITK